MWKFILLPVILICLFVFLYNMGFMVINSKSAVSYIGSTNGNGARFTSCNGSIKRIVRFKEDQECTYLLSAELSKGDISVELLDEKKNQVMRLTQSQPRATIHVVKHRKYYLVVNFKSATGSYSLMRV